MKLIFSHLINNLKEKLTDVLTILILEIFYEKKKNFDNLL